MKKAYLKELQSKLLGSITDNQDALDYFSTDLSIFQVTPSAIVYPQNTADVRKLVAFVAERTAAGKPLSLIPRGYGMDVGGAALGEGIQVVFPAHMNKLLRLDHASVTVQPGILYHTLQQTLHTHGRFLAPYPTSLAYSTIGAAVANNDAGEKAVKYGATRDAVKSLKVVLSDGSLIQTQRISARELNRKKGLSTLEGEVYRKLDNLLLDHADLIKKHQPNTTKNAAGYALAAVRGRDGSFDLGQVFIGSQGTLGIITEITLKTMPYNPRTTLVVGYFDSIAQAGAAVPKLRALGPSALEMVDHQLLAYVEAERPGELRDLLPEVTPKIALLIEFDDFSQFKQKLKSTRAAHILRRHDATVRISTDPVEQVALWKLRHSAAAALGLSDARRQALPFIEDAVVPLGHIATFLDKTYKLLARHDLQAAVWGHAGDGNFHLQPALDLGRKKDADKLFSLGHEFYQLVTGLGGTTSGSHGDGLFRSLYLGQVYGEEMLELFAATKHIFDPHGIFNPMKKSQATEEFTRGHLRQTYAFKSYDHIIFN
jgi:FAD/FMN-containing dehydrogenase